MPAAMTTAMSSTGSFQLVSEVTHGNYRYELCFVCSTETDKQFQCSACQEKYMLCTTCCAVHRCYHCSRLADVKDTPTVLIRDWNPLTQHESGEWTSSVLGASRISRFAHSRFMYRWCSRDNEATWHQLGVVDCTEALKLDPTNMASRRGGQAS